MRYIRLTQFRTNIFARRFALNFIQSGRIRRVTRPGATRLSLRSFRLGFSLARKRGRQLFRNPARTRRALRLVFYISLFFFSFGAQSNVARRGINRREEYRANRERRERARPPFVTVRPHYGARTAIFARGFSARAFRTLCLSVCSRERKRKANSRGSRTHAAAIAARRTEKTNNALLISQIMDHTMAGIEDILGKHGNYHVRDK